MKTDLDLPIENLKGMVKANEELAKEHSLISQDFYARAAEYQYAVCLLEIKRQEMLNA